LTDEAARGLVEGSIAERDLSIDAILPYDQNGSAKRVYIASIMTNPKQTAFSNIVVKEVLLLKFLEFTISAFPPADDRTLFAYAHTGLGETLLKNAEFRNTALSNDSEQGDPLYELTPDGYRNLARTFHVISKGLLRPAKQA
jgi:hypothetical protein